MDQAETNRFDELYQRYLRLLKLQGKSQKTIDAYARAVRRISEHFGCCPDQLTLEQREKYFSDLVKSHSWSTVKIDRNGLQFFWKHVLQRDWQWVNIVKAPKVRSLPDILTTTEVEQLIGATRNLRYRVFLLATYSMGLRLSETLALQVGDVDGQRKLVHIRRGKGHKDRFVPLPDLTYQALRALWCKHRNPCWFAPLRGANRGIELTLECLVAPLRSANQSFERTSLRLHESLRLSQARAFAQFRD